MINLSRKLLLLIPITALIIFFFLIGIPAGFAADQPAPPQADTPIPPARASSTSPATYTATLPPAFPTIIGTPRAPVTPLSLKETDIAPTLESMSAVIGTPTPLPDISTFTNQAVFSFRDIDVPTFTLHFPEIFAFDIDLPDHWLISPSQSYIEARYTLAEEYGNLFSTRSATGRYRYGYERPMIEVFVDDQLAGTIFPEVGEHTARIKLPFGLVESLQRNPSNTHTVYFYYDKGGDIFCDYGGVITFHDVSTINLTFSAFAPALTLSNYTQSLIQDSFIPETLLIIIPDEVNENDLTQVSRLSASIGRMAPFANLKLNVLRASEVSMTQLMKSSAIFIGTPNRNSYLSKLFLGDKFVTKLGGDGKTIQGVGANDGLLLLAHSDVNPNNTFLAITGNSDEGVNKALTDLAYPPVGLGGILFVSRTTYTPEYKPSPPPDTYRIAEFLYRERPVYGLGSQWRSFEFFVPRNWDVQEGSKLIVLYSHAHNLSYNNSGVSVFLNDTPIGGIPLDINDFGEMQFTFPIRKESIRIGALNRIDFQITLERELDCALYDARVSWFNIRDSSILHIPYKLITDPNNLPTMHDPIFYLSNEPKFVIVLPQRPNSQETNGMANLMRLLGTQLRTPFFDIKASTDPELDPKSYLDYNFILIGRPTRNAFIQKINNDLPQPFMPGADTLTLQQKIGDYRVEQSIGIGLVQAVEAPWNKMRGLTVITATNDDGLKWAFDRITSNDFIGEFIGELSFVESDKIQSFERGVPLHMNIASIVSGLSGKPASLEPVGTQLADLGTAPAPAPGDKYNPPKPAVTQNVGMILIIALVVLGLIIAAIGISRTIRGGRKR